jgi:hypothetical protein
MLFGISAVVLFVVFVALALWALYELTDMNSGRAAVIGFFAIVCLVLGIWLQTHRIVPTQHIGISKAAMSQELRGPLSNGLAKKPFWGSVHLYPASTNYERCETYTPALKGSYGITVDLCFYYDTASVDWLKEINRTGSLDANHIMNVWRNSIVGDVSKSVKEYTPEELSDKRAQVEESIFKNVSPWFEKRGILLTNVSFKNWDFTSQEVAKSFDESIVSQRKITEQTALLEAAKISRQREMYEAETAFMVAEQQKESLNVLGLEGDAAVQYLWIKVMSENEKTPDVLILGSGETPVSIPVSQEQSTQNQVPQGEEAP